MNDADYHALWHELNEANVEVVFAHRAERKERREKLVAALGHARAATVRILEVLSRRDEEEEGTAEAQRARRGSKERISEN